MNATQTKTEASIAVATRSASRELRLGAITAERRKARANNGAIRILSEARADQAFAPERVSDPRHARSSKNAATAVVATTRAVTESTRQKAR